MIIFSIIIPTYNRPKQLRKCLQSLLNLDYSRSHFEVIVVDDGSLMSLEPITAKFDMHLSLRMLQQPNAGPATARNTGAAIARGNYLVFLDDDCQPDACWLEAIAEALLDIPDVLVGGYTVNSLVRNLYSTASQLLIDYLYSYYNQNQKEATFVASNNFAVPRDLYQQIGGFNTHFSLAAGEDRDFCDRWLERGYKMIYNPSAIVYHAHHLTLNSFWRQHVNYGRGAFHFHQARHPRKQNMQPYTFYLNLLSYPLTQKSSQPKLLLVALFFLSQIATTVGLLHEKYQNKSLIS